VAAPHDWVIVPGERIGPVSATRAETALVALVGERRLARREIYLAEGFCTDGSILYPDTPDALEIAWSDSARTIPAYFRIRGAGSRWATASGVHVGSTVAEMEAIGGEPLSLSGFGWDYGGGSSWSEPGQTAGIGLQLSPDSASWERARADPLYGSILGDRTLRSDHPLLRRLNIVVETISLSLAPLLDEHECRGGG
jgi:hypothetical protein